MMYIKVIIGFALLLVAADFMVRGGVALARKLGVSPLIIGMTIIAIGTSAPELVVGLEAGLNGVPGLAMGNVIGSNIANVLLILGGAGLIAPIVSRQQSLSRDALVLGIGSIVFAAFCLQGEVSRTGGIVLVVCLIAFLISSYVRDHSEGNDGSEEVEEVGQLPDNMLITLIALFGGMAGIIYGADLLVDGGVEIALLFGVSEEVIGLTLVALGTSLPELAASVVAALRGHADVAIGNVVGSNLFNVLGIAGVVAIVVPLPVSSQLLSFDLWVMLATTAFMMPMLLWGWRLGRPAALVFLAAYGGYIALQASGVEQILGLT